MKAAVMLDKGKLEIRDVPDIKPGPYECLCRNLYATTCTGTDMKLLWNKLPARDVKYPSILGHETVGIVLETGRGVRNFKIGDMVLRPVYGYPGTVVNGFANEFGGFSEYGLVTDRLSALEDGFPLSASEASYSRFQLKLPDSWCTVPESVLLITLKETFSWVRRFGSFYGKNIAVIGVGAVGMFILKFASLSAPRKLIAFASGKSGEERALHCGADELRVLPSEGSSSPDKFDFILDAAGMLDRIDFLAREMLCEGGTIGIYAVSGVPETRYVSSGFCLDRRGPDESNPLIHETSIRMVERGTISLKDFASSFFPFAEMPHAFDLIAQKKEFKPLFRF
ncbi:MAG: NADP-dependent isopropanol dehydrogenase [Lentisphaerae bacterium ADurb.Bin242]|nr:MAG: NADP-dependent isopropanol dehydrogenase [Lentisphaerae bacterium ADurb.Bin242]